jgi:hypothetical protein
MSEPIPEQQPVAAEETTPEPEPSWQGPTRDEWEATQAQLQQYAQMLQPQQPQWQQQVPQAPDPFSETYQQDLDAYLDYRMAGSRQLEQEIRYAQAEDWAMGRFDELAESGGGFDRDAAYARANMILQQQGGDPVQALERAAREQREFEQRIGQEFYQRQIEQLTQNAGAPRGVSAGGVSAAQTVSTGGLGADPYAVTRKFFPQGGGR